MTSKQQNIGALFAVGVLLGSLWFASCKDPISGEPRANQPPRTYLWTDTVGIVQTSRVQIHWWGDDPDGLVKGYVVSMDGVTWSWTTAHDSTFSVTLSGLTTLVAHFRAAAVDMQGNGRWDATSYAGSINVGAEPFTDLDSNGVYTPGEPFVDYGAIDPNPPQLNVVIQNSPPSLRFADKTDVPAVTLPVASFLLTPTDVDGNETVVRFYLALNDTAQANWVEIPATATLITLVGDLSDTAATQTTARAYSGVELEDLGVNLPGLRLNANNVLYAYAEDLAGATSPITRMPDTTHTWFVKKPAGRRNLLLADDYNPANPNPDDVYRTALQSTPDASGLTFSDYDIIDLRSYPVPAPIHRPMLLKTFELYKIVFWYAKIANFGYAQNTLPEYVKSGGKVLMTSGFENFIDVLGLPIDFAPVDSLITSYTDSAGSTVYGYIPRTYQGSLILSTDTTKYPTLQFDRTALFGTYAVAPALGQTTIYTLDYPKNPPNTQEIWQGTPPVGIRSSDGKIIFMTVPMHLMNTPGTLVKFFTAVLRDDFGG